MTLVAAFRCDEGVVVCADSQETVALDIHSQYRVRVTKIKPQDAGEYEIVIGGEGNSGPLVDRFALELLDDVRRWPGELGNDEIEIRVGESLQRFSWSKSHVYHQMRTRR